MVISEVSITGSCAKGPQVVRMQAPKRFVFSDLEVKNQRKWTKSTTKDFTEHLNLWVNATKRSSVMALVANKNLCVQSPAQVKPSKLHCLELTRTLAAYLPTKQCNFQSNFTVWQKRNAASKEFPHIESPRVRQTSQWKQKPPIPSLKSQLQVWKSCQKISIWLHNLPREELLSAACLHLGVVDFS